MVLLLACADPAADRARFVEGLRTGECDAIVDPTLQDDCREATAETDADCAAVVSDTVRGECWFQLAEKRKDASLCPKATPFTEDCALHVLSGDFAAWLPKNARPGEHESEAEQRILASGLSADDMRPWSAYYRHVLSRVHPLDRSACAAVDDAARREACERTGIAHYQDLLNHARDNHLYPCDGGPLPPHLVYAPDPELDAVRASRTDLCRGTRP